MSIILAFDTATAAISVALQVDDRVIAARDIAPRRHNQLLLPMIERVIHDSGIAKHAIQAIAYGQGPGSFMGIRLAAGVAQGLALGLNIPVIPVSSLQCLAQTARLQSNLTSALVGWDARMGEVYWNYYACDAHGLMHAQQDDQLTKPVGIEAPVSHTTLVGNAWNIYHDELSAKLQTLPRLDDIYPDAVAMLPIALKKFNAQEMLPATAALPNYRRRAV